MSTLKKYNLEGKEVGEVSIGDELLQGQASAQSVKDYIVALRANARQWSANTLTRGEVKHTTKKPHRQKGTGRARQGSLVTPQFRGGGIVFGPKPKFDQHVRINKKERRAVIRHLLSEKLASGQLHVLEDVQMDEPKTKRVADFLKAIGVKGSVLFVANSNTAQVQVDDQAVSVDVRNEGTRAFSRSIRNLPKGGFGLMRNVSGYDIVRVQDVVMTESALKELEAWLS